MEQIKQDNKKLLEMNKTADQKCILTLNHSVF